MEKRIGEDLKRENKMGVMPIGKLLTTMSLPMVVSMLVQALYNLVDSIFVSRLDNALTAVGLAYPLQMLMIAVAVGTAVGINSLISRRLGAGRAEEANVAAANGLFLELVSALVFVIIGLTLVKPFIGLFTDNPVTYDLGVSYLRICMVFGFGVFIQCGAERILQSMGKTGLSMVAQLAGAITNLILDPILIFGYLGFPKMGIEGAATATVIGQVVGMTMALLLVFLGKHEVKVSFKRFRPSFPAIRDIYRVGLPSIVMQSIGSVMNTGMNMILTGILGSEIAVATMGVYYKMQSVIFMPLFGITNASMSIVAYNFGAGNLKRLKRAWVMTLIVCVGIMSLGTICFQIFPSTIISWFDSKREIGEMGISAFRIISIHFPIAAFCITASILFQALGRGVYSMVTSIMRQLGALLPAAAILALIIKSVDAVWWAFPIAEVVSFIISCLMLVKVSRQELSESNLTAR